MTQQQLNKTAYCNKNRMVLKCGRSLESRRAPLVGGDSVPGMVGSCRLLSTKKQKKLSASAKGVSIVSLLPKAYLPTFHTASLRLSHSLQCNPHPPLRFHPPPPPLLLSRAPSISPRSGLTRTGACAPRTSTTRRSVLKATRSWPMPVAAASLPRACAASAMDARRASTIRNGSNAACRVAAEDTPYAILV
jgi:hypothetical protein